MATASKEPTHHHAGSITTFNCNVEGEINNLNSCDRSRYIQEILLKLFGELDFFEFKSGWARILFVFAARAWIIVWFFGGTKICLFLWKYRGKYRFPVDLRRALFFRT